MIRKRAESSSSSHCLLLLFSTAVPSSHCVSIRSVHVGVSFTGSSKRRLSSPASLRGLWFHRPPLGPRKLNSSPVARAPIRYGLRAKHCHILRASRVLHGLWVLSGWHGTSDVIKTQGNAEENVSLEKAGFTFETNSGKGRLKLWFLLSSRYTLLPLSLNFFTCRVWL